VVVLDGLVQDAQETEVRAIGSPATVTLDSGAFVAADDGVGEVAFARATADVAEATAEARPGRSPSGELKCADRKSVV